MKLQRCNSTVFSGFCQHLASNAARNSATRSATPSGVPTSSARRTTADPTITPSATAHVSTAGLVLAGLGAAAGVVLLFVPTGPKPKTQTAIVAGPGFLGVKGTF